MLSRHIEQFIDTHGIKLEMDTNYILDAFTLKMRGGDGDISDDSGDYSKIILVKDSVKAQGTHVSYNDYIMESMESI